MRFSYPAIDFDAKTILHFAEIFESGWVSNSEHVRELEAHYCKMCDVKYALACCNATQGLTIAISAAGWKNKKVAVPAFTWPSTIYAIIHNSCDPVYCDIDPQTWAMDINSLKKSYDAIVPVDIFGNQVNISSRKFPVIYDAAHAYGLPLLGKRGLAEVVSMSHTKYPTASEGGIILTNDDKIAERASEERRLAARMSEANAIIGLNSIRKYDYFKAQRKAIIQRYLDGIKIPFTTQKVITATNNSVFAILIEPGLRDKIADHLRNKLDLEVKIYYEPIVSGLRNTDYVYKRILALPTHIRMFEILDDVIAGINTFA